MQMRLGERSRLTVTGKFGYTSAWERARTNTKHKHKTQKHKNTHTPRSYGMQGNEQLGIPSMADLIFDIEILEIGLEINMPTGEEIAKRKIAQQTTFIDRAGDR